MDNSLTRQQIESERENVIPFVLQQRQFLRAVLDAVKT